MKAETPYIHLHQRKRTWTPVEVTAGELLPGGEDVIKRALALRCLEIPVGAPKTRSGDLFFSPGALQERSNSVPRGLQEHSRLPRQLQELSKRP